MISRRAKSLTAFVVLPAIAVSGAMTMRPLTAADNRQAPADANLAQSKALFSEKCSACHNLPDPVEKGYNRAEWQRTVDKMLTKYGASDSISPAQAAQIVDYLATFAPRAGAAKPLDRWATDAVDVWTIDPARTFVTNFEAPDPLARLRQFVSGEKGTKPSWKIAADGSGGDGHIVRVAAPRAPGGRFAMLLDPQASGHDIDVSVRFRIDSGKESPAVGIAFGVKDAGNYQLIRYDAAKNVLSLMQIQEPVHQTLQKTDIATGADALEPSAASVTPAAAVSAPGQWHKLRVLVHGTTVRAWIDMTKRISIDDPSYAGGQVALWTQGDTAASFDDWTSDIYDQPGATAAAPI